MRACVGLRGLRGGVWQGEGRKLRGWEWLGWAGVDGGVWREWEGLECMDGASDAEDDIGRHSTSTALQRDEKGVK